MAFRLNRFQKKWLEALESGQHFQIFDVLYEDPNPDYHPECPGYCVLGLAAKVTAKEGECELNLASTDECQLGGELRIFAELLGLYGSEGEFGDPSFHMNRKGHEVDSLAQMNDGLHWSFSKIAEWIRKNPEAVFKQTSQEPEGEDDGIPIQQVSGNMVEEA